MAIATLPVPIFAFASMSDDVILMGSVGTEERTALLLATPRRMTQRGAWFKQVTSFAADAGPITLLDHSLEPVFALPIKTTSASGISAFEIVIFKVNEDGADMDIISKFPSPIRPAFISAIVCPQPHTSAQTLYVIYGDAQVAVVDAAGRALYQAAVTGLNLIDNIVVGATAALSPRGDAVCILLETSAGAVQVLHAPLTEAGDECRLPPLRAPALLVVDQTYAQTFLLSRVVSEYGVCAHGYVRACVCVV